jgi:hypothetical protein
VDGVVLGFRLSFVTQPATKKVNEAKMIIKAQYFIINPHFDESNKGSTQRLRVFDP